jgi:hypothetical protein
MEGEIDAQKNCRGLVGFGILVFQFFFPRRKRLVGNGDGVPSVSPTAFSLPKTKEWETRLSTLMAPQAFFFDLRRVGI